MRSRIFDLFEKKTEDNGIIGLIKAVSTFGLGLGGQVAGEVIEHLGDTFLAQRGCLRPVDAVEVDA